MKKGRGQIVVVSEKSHAAGGRGIPPSKNEGSGTRHKRFIRSEKGPSDVRAKYP
jgi:hypothetical protein